MPNQHSYVGGNDLVGRMFVYDLEMKRSDLNTGAIKTFARALRVGDLNTIQRLFGELTRTQKLGLITLYLDYADLSNHISLNGPRGKSIELARKFQYPAVAEYLTQVKNDVSLSELCSTAVTQHIEVADKPQASVAVTQSPITASLTEPSSTQDFLFPLRRSKAFYKTPAALSSDTTSSSTASSSHSSVAPKK